MAAVVESIQNRRRSPVRDVQNEIHGVEREIDRALASNARLIANMLHVGGLAGVQPADGQQALMRAIETMQLGAQMRALTIATHQDLREVVGKMDLKELGYGGLGDSPAVARDRIQEIMAQARIPSA